jgi:hypothetical protein
MFVVIISGVRYTHVHVNCVVCCSGSCVLLIAYMPI